MPLDAEGAGAVTPRPFVVVVCFSSFRLLELEVGRLRRTILGGYRHVVASARLLGRLPIVDVLATRGVVTECRAARGRKLDIVDRRAGVAGDLRSLKRRDHPGSLGQFV